MKTIVEGGGEGGGFEGGGEGGQFSMHIVIKKNFPSVISERSTRTPIS